MNQNELFYDVVVIGGGPAGLAAAIEAKKNGVDNILVIERDKELGGILQQCIHNGFGLHVFKEELTGPEYAERFIDELKSFNIEYKLDTMVLSLDEKKRIQAVNPKDGYLDIQAKSVILAMGCRERTRGAINIPGARPSGIFTAGMAQRFINIEGYMVGKKALILGSGDIGLIMARRLTLEGAKVQAVVELMPYSGGLTRNVVQCLEDFDIPLLLSHTVTKINGGDRLKGVEIAQIDENRNLIPGTQQYIECDTLLLSVGLIPENELSGNCDIKLDPVTSGPIVDENMQTSIEGVFACGNVVHVHDLVDFVTEESRKAGRAAADYILCSDQSNCDVKIEIVPSAGLRYVVPQFVTLNNSDDYLEFFTRSDNIYNDVLVVVNLDGNEVARIKKKKILPGEMERIRIRKDDLVAYSKDSTISISIFKESDYEYQEDGLYSMSSRVSVRS